MNRIEYFVPVMIGAVIFGIMMWVAMYFYARRKGTRLCLIIPYVLFAIFSAGIYFNVHHTGIVLLFLVWWMWVSMESDIDNVKSFFNISEHEKKIVKNFMMTVGTLMMLISLYWSVSASVLDARYKYAQGGDMAAFIKEHSLDNYNIMARWDVKFDENGNVKSMDTNLCAYVDEIGAYFDHNIFYNFMDGRDDVNYISHRIATNEENESNLKKWKQMGKPDVLVQTPVLRFLFDEDELSYDDYALVYSDMEYMVWRNKLSPAIVQIFVRKDLLDETGLKELDEVPIIFE